MSYIDRKIAERARTWESAKALLDAADGENRDLSAEESAQYDAMNADLVRIDEQVRSMLADEQRAKEIDDATRGHVEARGESRERESGESIVDREIEQIRKLARGEIRSVTFERRDVTKSATGAPVPTSFYDQIMTVARYVGPMLDVGTILNTASGENLQIPRTNAYSTGSVTSEGSTIGESDPTFLAFLTLGAFKESFLTQVSTEMLDDSGIDILGYLGTNVGQALGYAVNAHLTTGTGTTQPTGLVPSAGSGVTGGTAVSGAFTTDNVIDLVYSLNKAVRGMPGFGLMGSTTATANARKLKDDSGQYIWQPSLIAGEPDRLMGYRFVENPHMAAVATSAKSLIAGDLKSFLIRQVGGIRVERSDDYAFADDLVTFKAILRIDSGLPQSTHVKYFAGAAS